jgi:hypothetical protein
MLMQILSHMPSWVFVLFFILLALGIHQSRRRLMSRARVTTLPIVMLMLSFLGILSLHGELLLAFFAWAGGLTITMWLALRKMDQRKVRFFPERNEFSVPGSWLPLALMMGIFMAKTIVGITSALNPVLASSATFVFAAGLVYGVFSGLFLARGLNILRAKNVNTNPDLNYIATS